MNWNWEVPVVANFECECGAIRIEIHGYKGDLKRNHSITGVRSYFVKFMPWGIRCGLARTATSAMALIGGRYKLPSPVTLSLLGSS